MIFKNSFTLFFSFLQKPSIQTSSIYNIIELFNLQKQNIPIYGLTYIDVYINMYSSSYISTLYPKKIKINKKFRTLQLIFELIIQKVKYIFA